MDVIGSIFRIMDSRQKRRFVYFLLAYNGLSALFFANTFVTFLLLNKLFKGQAGPFQLDTIIHISIPVYAVAVLTMVSVVSYEVLSHWVQSVYIQFRENLRTRVAMMYLTGILHLDEESYHRTNYNAYIRMCYNNSQNVVYVLHLLKEASVALLNVGVCTVLILQLNSYVVAVLTLSILTYYFLKFNHKKRTELTTVGFENENVTKAYLMYLDDIFNLYKLIKIYRREPDLLKQAEVSIRAVSASNVVLARRELLTGNFLHAVLLLLLLAGVVFVQFYRVGLLTLLPGLMIIVLAIQRLIPSMNVMYLFVNHLNTSDYIIREAAILLTKPAVLPPALPIDGFQQIRVLNAQFSYAHVPVFTRLSYTIKANQLIGVTGESGRGKTTFLEIIAGLKNYSSGEIYVDDHLIQSFNQITPLVSLMTQQTYLMNDTVRNNVTLYNDAISDEQIWRVLDLVNMKGHVEQHADGLDRVLLKGGTDVSGGQAQRIGIARALLYNTKILLLDEFTASLDHDNKMQLCDLLLKLKQRITIIVSTHDKAIDHIFDCKIALQ